MPREISPAFFMAPTLDIAPRLIGKLLQAGPCVGRIVEVEAYTDDAASHGHRRTSRSNIMHDTYGMVYVYFIYGMYYCLNFTTDRRGTGAILIRALEPLTGLAQMRRRRGVDDVRQLCSGPGKLTSACGIDQKFNWTPVGGQLKILPGRAGDIVQASRIGIRKATDLPWRFYERDNEFVSRK